MDINGKGILYLKSVFSKLSDPKLKEGICQPTNKETYEEQ